MRDAHYRGVPALGGPMSSTDPQRTFPDEYGNNVRESACRERDYRRVQRLCECRLQIHVYFEVVR